MPDKRDETNTESGISVHILSVSAAMVGVCLTVICALAAYEFV